MSDASMHSEVIEEARSSGGCPTEDTLTTVAILKIFDDRG